MPRPRQTDGPQPIPYKEGQTTGFRVNFAHKGRRYRQRFPDPGGRQQALAFIKQTLSESRPAKGSLSDQVRAYLDDAERLGKKRLSTIRNDRQRLGAFITWCDGQGAKTSRDVNVKLIREFQNHRFKVLSDQGKDPRPTWEKYRQILNAFLNWCQARDLISVNPISGAAGKEFRYKPKRSFPSRIFTPQELLQVFESIDARGDRILSAFFRLAAYTGMRVGEITGLKWANVDLEKGRIDVVGTVRGDTKSGKSRAIPLADDLRPVLDSLPQDTRLVLDNSQGRPAYTESWYWRVLRDTTEALEIEPARIHDFRHTFASHLVMAGVDLFTVKELLGHADIQMTIDTYSHLSPHHAAGAIEKLPY